MIQPDSNGPRLEMWEPGRITPYDKNPRSLPQKAVDKVAGSLKAFGFQKPIVVDEQGVIIAGHVVYKAALQAGFARLPVLISNLDAKAARAYRLADNRTAQETDWLDDLLGDEMLALDAAGFDLDALGFDDEELARLLGEASNEAIANGTGSLADRFGIPPFSVLNAREGWWQERKRTWIAIGIQSELGRGETGVNSPHASPDGLVAVRAQQKAARNGAVPGGGGKTAIYRKGASFKYDNA